MFSLKSDFKKNYILSALPDRVYQMCASSIEPVDLPTGYEIAWTGEPVDHLYFPTSGSVSVILNAGHQRMLQVGMFGPEGFGPATETLGGGVHLHDIAVQTAGEGFRIPVDQLPLLLEEAAEFSARLHLFVQVAASQASQTALATASRKVDIRLARWLLMSQDRTGERCISVTHEYLSKMLAVRRPSITDAMHAMEGKGLIRSTRGQVFIRDRCGLEDIAGAYYVRAGQWRFPSDKVPEVSSKLPRRNSEASAHESGTTKPH